MAVIMAALSSEENPFATMYGTRAAVKVYRGKIRAGSSMRARGQHDREGEMAKINVGCLQLQ